MRRYALLCALLLAGCAVGQSTPTSTPTASVAASWPAPDDRLTPGAVVACTLPRPPSQRDVPAAEKRAVAAAYHYTGPGGIAYVEYDHRVPFALCGANDARNIWPEPYDGANRSAYVWNFKDQLEAAVIRAVRSGRLTLAQGQAVFMGDWRTAWCKWVHTAGVVCSK